MKSLSWVLVISLVLEGKYEGRFRRTISKKWWAWRIAFDDEFMSLRQWSIFVTTAADHSRLKTAVGCWILHWQRQNECSGRRSLNSHTRESENLVEVGSDSLQKSLILWKNLEILLNPLRRTFPLVKRDMIEDYPRSQLDLVLTSIVLVCCHPEFTTKYHF